MWNDQLRVSSRPLGGAEAAPRKQPAKKKLNHVFLFQMRVVLPGVEHRIWLKEHSFNFDI